MASRTWSRSFLGRGSIMATDLTSGDDRHTCLGCLLGDGREATGTSSITAWQANDRIAIRDPHTGERLVAWAFRCGQYSGGRGVWGLTNGAQASGVQRPGAHGCLSAMMYKSVSHNIPPMLICGKFSAYTPMIGGISRHQPSRSREGYLDGCLYNQELNETAAR
jgi:hypothetical protein